MVMSSIKDKMSPVDSIEASKQERDYDSSHFLHIICSLLVVGPQQRYYNHKVYEHNEHKDYAHEHPYVQQRPEKVEQLFTHLGWLLISSPKLDPFLFKSYQAILFSMVRQLFGKSGIESSITSLQLGYDNRLLHIYLNRNEHTRGGSHEFDFSRSICDNQQSQRVLQCTMGYLVFSRGDRNFLIDFTNKNLQNIFGVKIHPIAGRISLVLMLYGQTC